jgi:hypothetical protein
MLAIELPNIPRIAKAEALIKKGKYAPTWGIQSERLYHSILKHRLWLCAKAGQGWSARYVGGFKTMDLAISAGEKLMDTNYIPALAKKRRTWRSKPASEAQFRYMYRLGIRVPDGCTSGQAAQLISHRLALHAVNSARSVVEASVMKGLEK